MNGKTLGLTASAVGASATAFGMFLPPVLTVRSNPELNSVHRADDVRSGEIFAVAACVAVSLVLARYGSTWTPFIAGVATAALMVGAYEWALSGKGRRA